MLKPIKIYILLSLLIFYSPIAGFSSGQDSSLLKKNLFTIGISNKTIQNTGLINQRLGIVYNMTYERFFKSNRQNLFFGFGSNIQFNNCRFSLSTSSSEINKNSFTYTEIKSLGIGASTSLNYFHDINEKSTLLFRVNPIFGLGEVISSSTSGFRNDSLLYESKSPPFSEVVTNKQTLFSIFGVNSEIGITKKVTPKNSILLSLGMNISSSIYSKMSLVTRIVEPTFRLGLLF
ncbi:MAG: hypothetical protein SGJ15_12775 [Bacteroidota bacterium]|nr:hypothetical protein [Bacteroidota bacterium]